MKQSDLMINVAYTLPIRLYELVEKTGNAKYGFVQARRNYRQNRQELEDLMNEYNLNEVEIPDFKATRFSNGSIDVVA